MSKPIYISHPYTADTEAERDQNCDNAEKWALWLCGRYECKPVHDWTRECRGRDRETPTERAEGLVRDQVQCMGCYAAVLCGPYLHQGMAYETSGHRLRIDLTTLGLRLPPAHYDVGVLDRIDALMHAAGIRRRRHA